MSGWVGGWGRGGWWDDSKHVYALLLPYLSQCCLLCSQAFSCACCLGVRAADKQVHVPVVPKYWQKMWTPPRQGRLSAAIAFASVVQVFDKKVSTMSFNRRCLASAAQWHGRQHVEGRVFVSALAVLASSV